MDDAPEQQRDSAGLGRVLIVALVLIAAALVIHLTPIRGYLADVQHLREKLLGLGIAVYPVTIVVVALLLACGVPRLPIHFAGGAIFGLWIGFLLTFLGALLGHYAMFVFMRWGGRDWVLRRWPSMRRWADAVHEHGIVGVLLARQLPLHSMMVNLCLALSSIGHSDFLIGTALGIIPEAIAATLIGAGLMKTSLAASSTYLALAAGAFAAIWIVGGYTFRLLRKNRKEKEQPT